MNARSFSGYSESIVLRIQNREDNVYPPHFIHEIKTKGYDVTDANLFHRKLMRFHRKETDNSVRPKLLVRYQLIHLHCEAFHRLKITRTQIDKNSKPWVQSKERFINF